MVKETYVLSKQRGLYWVCVCLEYYILRTRGRKDDRYVGRESEDERGRTKRRFSSIFD